MMTAEDPEVLYWYRHLQGNHREWTKRILTESVLHFAAPQTLNDPFDCRVHFRSSFSLKELKHKYSTLANKNMPHLNREQRRAKVAADLKAVDPQGLLSFMTSQLQAKVNTTGVLCLSATDSNILLWSHYAAGHKGLCLKFAATRYTPFFGLAQRVKYSQDYPQPDLLGASPEEQVDAFLLTKATDWMYEEEWRIIDHDKGPGGQVFPKEMLLGVIFGALMKEEDKEAVNTWLQERKHPVPLYQASVASDSFSLRIDPYKP